MNQAEKNVDQRQFEKVVDKVLCLKMMRFKLWLWFSVKKKNLPEWKSFTRYWRGCGDIDTLKW